MVKSPEVNDWVVVVVYDLSQVEVVVVVVEGTETMLVFDIDGGKAPVREKEVNVKSSEGKQECREEKWVNSSEIAIGVEVTEE